MAVIGSDRGQNVAEEVAEDTRRHPKAGGSRESAGANHAHTQTRARGVADGVGRSGRSAEGESVKAGTGAGRGGRESRVGIRCAPRISGLRHKAHG